MIRRLRSLRSGGAARCVRTMPGVAGGTAVDGGGWAVVAIGYFLPLGAMVRLEVLHQSGIPYSGEQNA
jgi:hypothetical protein